MVQWNLVYAYSLYFLLILILCLQVSMCSPRSLVIDDWFHVLNLAFLGLQSITFGAFRAACARSACVTLDTLDLRKDRSEESSPSTNAEGINSSGQSVLLHALKAKCNRNSIFSLRCSIPNCLNACLIGSWYLFRMPSTIWCCVPDVCHCTSWISQISTKLSLICESSQKTYVMCSPM